MKVSSSITNTVSDNTGLPSLLSSEAEPSLPANGLPIAPPKDSSSDPTSPSFDAVLAMLGVPLNLPLPPVTSPTPVVANESSGSATPLMMDLSARIPVTAAITAGAAAEIDNGGMKMTPAPLAFVAVEQRTDQRVLDDSKVLVTPVANPIETLKIPPELPAPLPTNNTSEPLTVADRPMKNVDDAGLHQSAGLAQPSVEQKPEAPPPEYTEPNPRIAPADVLPLRTAQPEITEIARRKPDDLSDVPGQKNVPHRHAAIEGRLVVEGTNPQPHTLEPTASAFSSMNSTSLTSSLAAAIQTHHSELAAGRPIELQLRLDPPELGMVRVHLRLTDDVVSVRFIAGDEAATRMLESQLPDLRQSLAERGLTFTQCDVTCDSRQQQAFDFQQSAERAPFAPTRLAPRAWPTASPTLRSSIARGDRLDVLA